MTKPSKSSRQPSFPLPSNLHAAPNSTAGHGVIIHSEPAIFQQRRKIYGLIPPLYNPLFLTIIHSSRCPLLFFSRVICLDTNITNKADFIWWPIFTVVLSYVLSTCIVLPHPSSQGRRPHPSKPSTNDRFSTEPRLLSMTEAAQFCFTSPLCFYILGGIYLSPPQMCRRLTDQGYFNQPVWPLPLTTIYVSLPRDEHWSKRQTFPDIWKLLFY